MVRWFWRDAAAPWWRRLDWRRTLAVSSSLAFMVYVAGVGAIFGFVRFSRGVEGVRFVDLLLPSRWGNYQIARGNQHLATAKHLTAQRMSREALLYARTGLAKAPANREGRLLLFELLLAMGRVDEARSTLLDGVAFHANDPIFLRPLLTFLLHQQEDRRVVELVRQCLPHVGVATEQARLLVFAAAMASFHRGNFDVAEDFLRGDGGLAGSRDGRLLMAKIEWDRGYRELALVQLRGLAAELPRDRDVQRELVSHLRRHGLHDEARRSGLSFHLAFPDQPSARLELLRGYRLTNDEERATREVEALLRDFPDDQSAGLALADYAASKGDVALVRRIAERAVDRRWPREALAMLTIEALIVARDFPAALASIRSYRENFSAGERRNGGVCDSLQAAALFGLGDATAAAIYLNAFLGQANLRADNLLAVANRFVELGAEEPARRVLSRAVEIDPQNQAALSRLVELDILANEGEDLARHLQQLIRMRRPPPDILRVAQQKLGSDLFLFSRECALAWEALRTAQGRPAGAKSDAARSH